MDKKLKEKMIESLFRLYAEQTGYEKYEYKKKEDCELPKNTQGKKLI